MCPYAFLKGKTLLEKKLIFLFCSEYHWKNRCFSFEANVETLELQEIEKNFQE